MPDPDAMLPRRQKPLWHKPPTVRTSDNQLLCCKSIDKLIAEADEPGHRLQEDAGPVVAYGAGHRRDHRLGDICLDRDGCGRRALRGSFDPARASAGSASATYCGTGSTAGALMHGRPPAGPSIAISFLLVAVACSFAGLVLRRTGVDDSDRGQRLHLFLRNPG